MDFTMLGLYWVAPQQWKFFKTDSTSELVQRGGTILLWKDCFSWERQQIDSASSCATEQQATSTATATKTQEFPPISESAKFYTERTWTQVRSTEPVPGFNKASTSIHSCTTILFAKNGKFWQNQLNRNHFFQEGVANEVGSEKQRTCFWGGFVLLLHFTRNKSKRTKVLDRKRGSNRMHCCSRGATQNKSQPMLSSGKLRKQMGFQSGTE